MNIKVNLPQEDQVFEQIAPNQALIDALLSRRSTKIIDLADGNAPNDKEIAEIIKVATRVPDHGKIAPWRFVIIKDENREKLGVKLANLAKAKNPNMDDAQYEMEKTKFLRAPLILALVNRPQSHPKVPIWEQELSAGALGFSLLLTLHGFGYGACWLSEWPMFDEEAAEIIGAQENERIAGLFYVGTTITKPTERPRPELNTILSVWNG